jgi:hypothetical protein
MFVREGRNEAGERRVCTMWYVAGREGEKCKFVCKLAMGAGMDV